MPHNIKDALLIYNPTSGRRRHRRFADVEQATRVLKDYHDSKHGKTEDEGMLSLTVPESLRTRAADALARAQQMLQEPEQGRGR